MLRILPNLAGLVFTFSPRRCCYFGSRGTVWRKHNWTLKQKKLTPINMVTKSFRWKSGFASSKVDQIVCCQVLHASLLSSRDDYDASMHTATSTVLYFVCCDFTTSSTFDQIQFIILPRL
ncbi:hypothetical protein BDW62DRAFT_69034 [Aspergillus aurantiobrunneus]